MPHNRLLPTGAWVRIMRDRGYDPERSPEVAPEVYHRGQGISGPILCAKVRLCVRAAPSCGQLIDPGQRGGVPRHKLHPTIASFLIVTPSSATRRGHRHPPQRDKWSRFAFLRGPSDVR